LGSVPILTSLSTASGGVGQAVTLTGANFGSVQGTSTVTFNGATSTVTSWSNISITTNVPVGATTGNVVVSVGGVASNGMTFTVRASGAYYPGTLRQPTCSDASLDAAISASVSGDIVRMASACQSLTASISIPNTKGILFDGNGSTFGSGSTIRVDP